MRALEFRYSVPRIAAVRVIGAVHPPAYVWPLSPLRLVEGRAPALPGPEWVRVRTRAAGICGSDLKQVKVNGAFDNAMTALISLPHVLGHEAVGTVAEIGAAGASLHVGQRVLLDPWLPCAARGIAPRCPACEGGYYSRCHNFDAGALPPGIHLGNNRGAPGAFADAFVAHRSQLIPLPDHVGDDAAVLADPFCVSLHSVLLRPPPADAPVLVYGLGTLGQMAVAALTALHPRVPVLAVGRHAHQLELARRLGARHVMAGPPAAVIEWAAGLTGAKLLRPWRGRPWSLDGVAVVYDTVGTPATVEAAIRVVRGGGSVVLSGVEAPRRFEWTPLYFKEVELVGSNAFGMETFEGRRLHAMKVYLALVARGLDVTPLISHRFPLARWREAFRVLIGRRRTRAVKVLLEP